MPPELNDLSEAAANIHCRCALFHVPLHLSYLHNIKHTDTVHECRVIFHSSTFFVFIISFFKAFHNLKNRFYIKQKMSISIQRLIIYIYLNCTVQWNNLGDSCGEFQRKTILERLWLPHFALKVLWYNHWLVHGIKCIQVVQFTSSTNIYSFESPYCRKVELFFYIVFRLINVCIGCSDETCKLRDSLGAFCSRKTLFAQFVWIVQCVKW